jgi:hypothetical protein
MPLPQGERCTEHVEAVVEANGSREFVISMSSPPSSQLPRGAGTTHKPRPYALNGEGAPSRRAALVDLPDNEPAPARGRRTEAVLVLSPMEFAGLLRSPISPEHITPSRPWSVLTTFTIFSGNWRASLIHFQGIDEPIMLLR